MQLLTLGCQYFSKDVVRVTSLYQTEARSDTIPTVSLLRLLDLWCYIINMPSCQGFTFLFCFVSFKVPGKSLIKYIYHITCTFT